MKERPEQKCHFLRQDFALKSIILFIFLGLNGIKNILYKFVTFHEINLSKKLLRIISAGNFVPRKTILYNFLGFNG